MILAILACKIGEASNIISVFKWIKFCSSLLRAEQKLSRYRERERCSCVPWTETEQTVRRRERERCVCACWTETEQTVRRRERERGECACSESKTSRSRGSTGVSQRLNKVWVLFWGGGEVAKGVCNVAKMATLCISISQFLRVGPRLKQKIRAALIAC